MRTQSTRSETAVAVPPLMLDRRGEYRIRPTAAPLSSITANETTKAVVVPLRNHGVAKPVEDPIDTVAASGNHHALVMRNNGEPLSTLTTAGHQSLVVPSTITDKALMDLVMDAEFRMLEPSEIKRGMAFASEYILLGNRREQVKMAGNAVTPNAARDIIAACVESLGVEVAA
jgi:DNA (cytosine-5)-methyltransferase 1